MKNKGRILASLLFAASAVCVAQAPGAQAPGGVQGQPAVPEPIRQARQLNAQGKPDEALAVYRQFLEQNPTSYEANAGAGVVLDLKGDYTEARKYLAKAIEVANEQQKIGAWKSMAMSYAFEHKAKDSAKYEQKAFDLQMSKQDYTAGAETANEQARLSIESGDLNDAEKWYKLGHETAFKKAGLSDAEKDLWNFRWEHAQARIAARRGKKKDAAEHVAAAKAIIDRGVIDKQQAVFFPYLTGYVAFYGGDYATAIAELQKANQRDPFILSLLAQAYEKSGQKDQAMELYKKVLTFNIHNPTGAFSRPLAKQKVGG